MCADMCVEMRVDMCLDMRVDMCIGVRALPRACWPHRPAPPRVAPPRPSPRPHVRRHVHRSEHVRRAYRHAARQRCKASRRDGFAKAPACLLPCIRRHTTADPAPLRSELSCGDNVGQHPVIKTMLVIRPYCYRTIFGIRPY